MANKWASRVKSAVRCGKTRTYAHVIMQIYKGKSFMIDFNLNLGSYSYRTSCSPEKVDYPADVTRPDRRDQTAREKFDQASIFRITNDKAHFADGAV